MSDVSGRAVQARNVQGGIHFHGHGGEHSTAPIPRELPGDVHGFINRVGELEVLDEYVRDRDSEGQKETRIHVIVGTAGVGKTALALRWAHRVRHCFPDGQLYVDLRGYGPGQTILPDQALDRFLRALGVAADAIPGELDSKAAMYRSLLAERRIIILLDNVATTTQVRPLLPGSPSCVVVATSRDRLSGLVAREGARRVTVRTLDTTESVALLEHSIANHREHDAPEDMSELARLCGQLPLALRIAAERAASRPHMPLADLIQDLRDESVLWDALASDDEEEAYAVRSVFAWSYRALPEEAARLFRLLGLHPGPDFGADAAAALCGLSPSRVRRTLDSLVGAHLVEQTAIDRYRIHDLLRSYAVDQVRREESPEQQRAAMERLIKWYLWTADAAARATDSHLRHLTPRESADAPTDTENPTFSGHTDSLHWFDREFRNLAAVTEAAADVGLDELTWRIPVVLRHVYVYYVPNSEWERMLALGLAAAVREGESGAEADLLEALGMVHVQGHRYAEGLEHHERALELRRAAEDRFGSAMSLNSVGLAHLRARHLDQADECFRRSLGILEELERRIWSGIVLGNLARTLLEQGHREECVPLAEEAVRIHYETGNRLSEFSCLATLSSARREMGRADQALVAVGRALEVAEQLESSFREGFALLELGRVQTRLGQCHDALDSYQRAAALHRRGADRLREAEAFEGAGDAHRTLGDLVEAVGFYLQAANGYRSSGSPWHLANCLFRLAALHQESGQTGRAQQECAEAMEILDGFTDVRSAVLREQVESLMRAVRD